MDFSSIDGYLFAALFLVNLYRYYKTDKELKEAKKEIERLKIKINSLKNDRIPFL